MTTLARLQSWYAAQCDGDWEHQKGLTIESLDNPGWRVTVSLTGTHLDGATLEELSSLEPAVDWIRCWHADGHFHGAGGPQMLEAILGYFLDWAEGLPPDG